MSNINYDLTHEIINIQDLGPPLQKSRDEWQYHCHNCIEKRGKADTEGRLWFNVSKQVGLCFVCNTSFHPEPEEGADLDELEWQKIQGSILSRMPMAIFNDIEEPKEVAFNFTELDYEQIWYLKNRNPFLFALKNWLGIKGWSGRDKGVVLPFFYKDKICKYQTRFISRKNGAKYFTSPGVKPLYSPMHILNEFKLQEGPPEITLCEGVFDSIALWILGFPNPLAVLGSTITPLQLYDIRSLSPLVTRVYICLDDWERSLAVSKVVRKHILALESTEIFTKWGGKGSDPEDFLNTAILDPATKQEYSQRVSSFLEKVK
jgi:hypothetical protein